MAGTRAVRYNPGTAEYSYREAGADHALTPGGSGNATSIRGYPVESGTPLEGEAITYDADGEQWVYAAGGGGVPEAPNDGKLYGRKSLGWTEATAGEVGADATGTAASAVSGHSALTSGVHGAGAGNLETVAGAAAQVSSHAGAATGVHGVGAGTVESTSGAQGKVDAHKDLATGVHGAGASTLATTANIATHAGATSSVHGFDGSGNAPPQSHDGTKHSETYAQVAGQLGGSSASPDVRGIRTTTGPTLLTIGAVADGEYLKRSANTLIGGTPAGGSTPAWHGVLHSTQNGCDPYEMIREWTMGGVAGPTPTLLTTSVARCVLFKCPAAITVNRVHLFGVGVTANLYKFAIYPKAVGSARTWESGTVTTAANAWLSISAGLPISLSSGAEYWFCVTAANTGTTAGFRSLPAPLGDNFWGASAAPIGNRGISLGEFAQFAVSSGAFPATLPTIAKAAYANGATGSVPFALLDNSSA